LLKIEKKIENLPGGFFVSLDKQKRKRGETNKKTLSL